MTSLADYARIPIDFEVSRILDVTPPGGDATGFLYSERAVDESFMKDYDAAEENGPLSWPDRFDLSNWALFAARVEGNRVGGAVVAFRTPGAAMLDGRNDLAMLWDIRVAPEMRNHGVGSALLAVVEEWIVERGAKSLKVETQNINVPACRFYECRGFVLRAANEDAYPDFPEEIQLLWYKDVPVK